MVNQTSLQSSITMNSSYPSIKFKDVLQDKSAGANCTKIKISHKSHTNLTNPTNITNLTNPTYLTNLTNPTYITNLTNITIKSHQNISQVSHKNLTNITSLTNLANIKDNYCVRFVSLDRYSSADCHSFIYYTLLFMT